MGRTGGWDEPRAEITAVKSAKPIYTAKDRREAEREFGRVKVTPKRDGDNPIVETEFPRGGAGFRLCA